MSTGERRPDRMVYLAKAAHSGSGSGDARTAKLCPQNTVRDAGTAQGSNISPHNFSSANARQVSSSMPAIPGASADPSKWARPIEWMGAESKAAFEQRVCRPAMSKPQIKEGLPAIRAKTASRRWFLTAVHELHGAKILSPLRSRIRISDCAHTASPRDPRTSRVGPTLRRHAWLTHNKIRFPDSSTILKQAVSVLWMFLAR